MVLLRLEGRTPSGTFGFDGEAKIKYVILLNIKKYFD